MTEPLSRRQGVIRRAVTVDCSDLPSMAKQEFRDQCDINNIMKKYYRTGVMAFSNDIKAGRYLDLTTVSDYHTSLNKVRRAEDAFDALPSKVRSFFDNDPANLLAFLADPKNIDKARELGLAKPLHAGVPPANAASAPAGNAPPGASNSTIAGSGQ